MPDLNLRSSHLQKERTLFTGMSSIHLCGVASHSSASSDGMDRFTRLIENQHRKENNKN